MQSCFSVAEALQLLRGGLAPDVIVFDLIMPQQDGFDLLRIMRDEKLAPKAVKVALTNQMASEERKKTEELGADEFIIKASAIPSEVMTLVVAAIARHQK